MEGVKEKIWTVVDLLKTASGYLEDRGVDNARLNAEWLLAEVLHCRRLDLYVNYDRPLSSKELSLFREYLRRRARHEPLQYILGYTEFMGLKLEVTPHVLIPRPDTEILVESVEQTIWKSNPGEPVRVLDIGTGTGAIIIALTRRMKDRKIPVEPYAMDICGKALDIAKRNARMHDCDEIRFFQGDVLNEESLMSYRHTFHVVVSNPPYLSAEEYALLSPEVRQFEPCMALDGGEDGLMFYRKIADLTRNLLNPCASLGMIFLETGYDQASSVKTILEHHGFKNIEFFKDYQHIDRVVKGLR